MRRSISPNGRSAIRGAPLPCAICSICRAGSICSVREPDGTLNTYFGGGVDAGAFAAINAYEHAPGSHWCYSNFDTLMLARAIRFTFPSLDEYLTFPRRELFSRIGMRDTVMETDKFGNFIASSQIWTTPRDLARFGLLYMNDGVWNGERILPEGWVAFSRTPARRHCPSRAGNIHGATAPNSGCSTRTREFQPTLLRPSGTAARTPPSFLRVTLWSFAWA